MKQEPPKGAVLTKHISLPEEPKQPLEDHQDEQGALPKNNQNIMSFKQRLMQSKIGGT